MKFRRVEYLHDSGYACGLLITYQGIIIDSAPIYRKLVGKNVSNLKGKLMELRTYD